MYKVFIENRPVIFEFDPNDSARLKSEQARLRLDEFIASNEKELHLLIKSEKAFWKVFKAYEYIEAAGGLVERNGQYLFIFRNGKWDIPKGKLDKGEAIEVAAVREIEEECGLEKPVIMKELNPTFHTYKLKEKMVIKKTYWFVLKDMHPKELVPQLEEGITDLKFVSPKNFDAILSNTYPSIADVIKNFNKTLG